MSYPLQFPFFQGWVATWKKRAVLLGNCIDNAVPGSGRCSGSLDAWMMPEMRIHPYLSVKCHSIMENHDEPDLEAPNLHTKPHVFYVKGNFLHLWDKPWRHMIWLWLQYCLPLPKNRMINPKKSLNVVSGAILCPSHLGKPISLGSATFPPSCAKETSRETVNSSENLCSMTHQRLNCWNLHLVRNPPKMPSFSGLCAKIASNSTRVILATKLTSSISLQPCFRVGLAWGTFQVAIFSDQGTSIDLSLTKSTHWVVPNWQIPILGGQITSYDTVG